MNKSYQTLKDEILSMVIELRESISILSIKVSVLATQMDMIKVVGSTAIGLIVTLLVTSFTLLYNQISHVRQEMKVEINQVRQEMNTKFDKIDQKFDKIDQKFDKLYDLIANKK